VSRPAFTLSAFGDEVATDLEDQLAALDKAGLRYLEFRSAWGRNVVDLGPAELHRARAALDARGFEVSAIGSPVGKSGLERPPAYELDRLERALAAADTLGTRLVRVFSFYVPPGEADRHRAEVHDRLGGLVSRAASAGAVLLLENEKDLYGDTPERCADLLAGIGSPSLRLAFDPANFVQVGVRPLERAWPLLAPLVAHVHVKDARLEDGTVVPVGEGGGQWPELLEALTASGYAGFLTLEPHLVVAGPSGGFSGEAGLNRAMEALRNLLEG